MGDKPFLTAIVKARFAFRLNASMVLTGRPLIADRDRHLDDDPTKSVREPGDVVPHRERCDVWLRGHARPLGGKPVGVSMVRLAVFRAGIPMIDKTIHVLGERMSLGGAPRPYATMPLVWERAYGGVGFDANPVGVGADERLALPNLVDPMDAERAIGFGPISRYWKTRRGRVTTAERKQVEASQPRIAEGFDWAYYQAAPRDQQLTYLHGDEWLVLDGVDADRLRIQTRLPKVKAQARLLPRRSSPSDMGEIIPLVADSWGIDADEQVCTVTWRGAIPLAPQRDAAVLVAGAVTIDDAPVDWAQAYERVQLPPPDRLQPPRRAFGGGVTQISEAPPGAGAELVEDPLAATTIDPPRALANPSRPIESWPSLDGGEEEPVENTTDVTMDDLAITAPQTAPPAESAAELTAPQPMPLAIDT
ncbi:MAG: DUF2169 domain-containing protein, partial [Myxococcales bacterium]|nr:DUF2169 domain-containing protein [Myxococcales bacterium]